VGAGRTEVAEAIFGLDPKAQGTVVLESNPLPPGNPRLAMARGLDAARLAEQCRSIATLNAGGGRARLLTGVEVDILRDGRLDLDDEVLAGLDVVVASAHLGLRSDGMTERLEGAIKNPHVDIIGHPTGRLLSGRGGASVDLERLLGLAARTGTALEINASPDRLDLGAEWARRARECGVRLAISSDAHSLAGLDDLRYGVGTARRGWLEPKDVLNTDSLPELLARRA
jgi:DNA polymerase (family 10)